MVDTVLSQEEIDRLSRGGAKTGRQARPYNLTRQERFIPHKMPTFDRINEEFAHSAQKGISVLLQKEMLFLPQAVRISEFGEFIQGLSVPSSLNVIKMEPLRGHALFVIDTKTVYFLVDTFCGGGGGAIQKTADRFSPIEDKFIRKILNLLLEELQRAWRPVYPVQASCVLSATDTEFAMIVPPTETVITIPFRLTIATTATGATGAEGAAPSTGGYDILFCLPYPTIEAARDKLYATFQPVKLDETQKTDAFHEHLADCNVEAVVDLGHAYLTLPEIGALKTGDVIELSKFITDNLEVRLGGVPKLSGRPGMYRGKRALQIDHIVLEGGDSNNG